MFCGSRSDMGPALSQEAFVGVSSATFGVLLGQGSFTPRSWILAVGGSCHRAGGGRSLGTWRSPGWVEVSQGGLISKL